MVHAHWYLRFRRFSEEALDLRRSSNMRRSRYVAASWGGWKDPFGIIVGGVDLGGMVFENDARTVVVVVVGVVREGGESLSPSVTTCGGGDQRSSYDLVLPVFPCRVGAATPKTPETEILAKPHVVHRPGDRGGGGSLRLCRRSLQKLHCAFGMTGNCQLPPLLTLDQ